MSIDRRLQALRDTEGHYRILALDHGLSSGHARGALDLARISEINRCAPGITGFVANPGLASNPAFLPTVPLIVQTFSAPRGHTRVPICTAVDAVRLGATAISVQFDRAAPELSAHLRLLSRWTHEAHALGLPVLWMTSGYKADSAREIADAVRIAQEVGADLVKIQAELADDTTARLLADAIAVAPPVLIAGGDSSNNTHQVVATAMDLNCSGFCIGRAVFESADPVATLDGLNRIVSTRYST